MPVRVLFSLIAVALLLGGGYFFGRSFISSGAQKALPVEIAEVSTQDIVQTVTCVGEAEPSLFTELKSEVSGRIEKVLVKPGDRVEKDAVLVELDRSELETQIREAVLAIEASRLALEKVRLDYESKKDLHEKQFVPAREFQDAEIDYAIAKNELDIQKARSQLLQDKLDKTTIKAPHSGVILGDELTEGTVITGASSVSNGDVLMQVAQLNGLLVKTEVSEVDVVKIAADKPVTLTFDSLPGVELPGKITFISPSAQPKSSLSSQSGNARVFPITVAFSTNNVRVRPGMTAQVTIVLDSVQDVLAAELPTLFLEDGENVVYVKTGDSFDRRVVEIGINDHDYVEIKSGLKKGESLATSRPEGFDPNKSDPDSKARRT